LSLQKIPSEPEFERLRKRSVVDAYLLPVDFPDMDRWNGPFEEDAIVASRAFGFE